MTTFSTLLKLMEIFWTSGLGRSLPFSECLYGLSGMVWYWAVGSTERRSEMNESAMNNVYEFREQYSYMAIIRLAHCKWAVFKVMGILSPELPLLTGPVTVRTITPSSGSARPVVRFSSILLAGSMWRPVSSSPPTWASRNSRRCLVTRRWPRPCGTGWPITAISSKPATTATASKTQSHNNRRIPELVNGNDLRP